MATLEDRQSAERAKLEMLCNALESRAHDLRSLLDVLAAAKDFQGLDALPHIKAAMRHYLERAN
ncbi:hypothetical protein [Spongiibacter marinus]|uniref:hypothetical protein n=1 Tax=Spongiibacter marinus TaxID=354246 RepID=UPI0019602401|nr:hypothetical protein [Spongiibacter marinus]MBM7424937.1 hypothetical protein [Spongiibacter marinus]